MMRRGGVLECLRVSNDDFWALKHRRGKLTKFEVFLWFLYVSVSFGRRDCMRNRDIERATRANRVTTERSDAEEGFPSHPCSNQG